MLIFGKINYLNLLSAEANTNKTGNWVRVILFLAVFLAVFMAAAGFVYPLASARGITPLLAPALSFALPAWTTVLFFTRFADRRKLSSLGINLHPQPQHIFGGLGWAFFMLTISWLVLAGTDNIRTTWAGGQDILLSAGLMLLIAMSEEIVFRGYIQVNLTEATGNLVGIGGSSMLFAMVHSANPGTGILPLINVFLAGVFLATARALSKQLWLPVAFHFWWNFLQGPVAGFPVSGISTDSLFITKMSGNKLLTGGIFGLEGSLIQTCLFIMATAILAYQKKSRFTKQTGTI